MTLTMQEAIERGQRIMDLAGCYINQEQIDDLVQIAYSVHGIATLRGTGEEDMAAKYFDMMIFLIMNKAIKGSRP